MRKLAEYSDAATEEEIIRILRGVVMPSVHYLNSMPQEKRLYYAPWLVGGTDAIIKLSILAFKGLYTPEVIRRLIESGTYLCGIYLKEVQDHGPCKKFNLKEFKRQVIRKNDEELLRLLFEFSRLSPQEEIELLTIRRNRCESRIPDELMRKYFSENGLTGPAGKLLNFPEYSHYWELYRQSRQLSRRERIKHFIFLSWYKFRYRLGL